MLSMKAGEYVVCTCEMKIVLIVKLTGMCSTANLLDVETYSGDDVGYNQYEFPISCYWVIPVPIPFEAVAYICRAPVKGPTPNNLLKPIRFRALAFYGKKGEPSPVLDRYYALIVRLMKGLTPIII